jgi:PHD/YefM family antitoxin component YafN of YafNO toxin-antitoxin module
MRLTFNFMSVVMIDLSNIHSLSEFQRNTKRFCLQMQESEKPVVLTVNGEAQLVVQDAKAYQKLLNRLEYMETVVALKQGIGEIEAGLGVSADEALESLRQKHGISG